MFGPVDVLHRKRRQLDMLSRPPIPGGNDGMPMSQLTSSAKEILYVAEVAVRSVDVKTVDRDDAAQMRIALSLRWLSMSVS